jgi:ectoine hydroxylase-related dioxygenase (phytanoyl-CoA dioxygenase family)
MAVQAREPISAEQAAFYQVNGYLLARGLFTREEAEEFRSVGHGLIERLAEHEDVEATWDSARTAAAGQETRLLHCHNVEYHSGTFARLITDPRLTDIASGLIGSPNVQLHHTKLFIKPPEKGSPFPMHQDHPFFPHERHSMIAAIIHFDDAPKEKGCLRVVPGSHAGGPIEHDPTGSFHLPVEQYPLESSVALPAEAGDVLFFSYLTVHGSGINVSDEARTTLLIQMRDPADRPLYAGAREAGEGLMLRGVLPAGARGMTAVQRLM